MSGRICLGYGHGRRTSSDVGGDRRPLRGGLKDSFLERLRALATDLETGARAVTAALKSGRTKVSEAFAADASVTQIKSRILQLQGELRRDESELARWTGSEAMAPPAEIPSMDDLPAEVGALRASAHKHVSLRPLDAQVESGAKLELARLRRPPEYGDQLRKRGPTTPTFAAVTVDLPLFARIAKT
jgi:hypothetical protein